MSFVNTSVHWFCSIMLVCGTRKLRQFLLGFQASSPFQFCACLTRRSNPFALLTGRHCVPPFSFELCSFDSLVVLRVIRVSKRCWLQGLCFLRLISGEVVAYDITCATIFSVEFEPEKCVIRVRCGYVFSNLQGRRWVIPYNHLKHSRR
jgi:hypothetical protein